MKTLFQYNSKVDLPEPSKRSINLFRFVGIVFIMMGIERLYPEGWGPNMFNNLMGIATSLLGVIYLVAPKKVFRTFSFRKNDVLINEEAISWDFGKKDRVENLMLDNITDIKITTGQVHFETKAGETHILPSYKIYHKGKHEDFQKIIEERAKQLSIA